MQSGMSVMSGSSNSQRRSIVSAAPNAQPESDERTELSLFLFKTNARNKMLAFKKILAAESPLRMLPLDFLETLDDEGFDIIVSTTTQQTGEDSKKRLSKSKGRKSKTRKDAKNETKAVSKSIYILCFVSMAHIEAYFKAHGLLNGNGQQLQ